MISVKVLRILALHDLEIRREIPAVHADICASHVFKPLPRALETLVHNLEQFALLWVHVCCFDITDSEKGIVEFSDVFLDEVPRGHVHASWSGVAVRVVEGIDVEARGWDGALSRAVFEEKLPQVGWGADTTW
jgi:hypothetical protein